LQWSNSYGAKQFIPCLVDEKLQILAVWTKQANSPNFRYIGQFWQYLQINKSKFVKFKSSIILGDFNSNKIWDESDRWWNHSDVVSELEEIGIQSAYHNLKKEEQGLETCPTLYFRRDSSRPYHVDYIFVHEEFLKGQNVSIDVGKLDQWVAHSDHMPIVLSVE
jgi:endonuclease/exonuclease/phosphatase family metal-dependent hydrolase